jgi:NAD(P)-dependent dehydrogenase (short-subunit alcohol dehydrogenase family)
MKFKGKTAVITGGNSGIGLAIAREFVANGARVAIFGRSRATLDAAQAELGANAITIQGDVRNISDLDRIYTEIQTAFGLVDIVVANAGIAKFAPVEVIPEALFDELSDVMFKGVFYTVQRALPHMRDGGSVVLVGSADADKRAEAEPRYIQQPRPRSARLLDPSRWSCCRDVSASTA